MEVGHVTYAQLTLPSPHRDGGHHHPFNQQHPRGMCAFKRQHKFIYTGSLAPADFSGAVFTCEHFQKSSNVFGSLQFSLKDSFTHTHFHILWLLRECPLLTSHVFWPILPTYLVLTLSYSITSYLGSYHGPLYLPKYGTSLTDVPQWFHSCGFMWIFARLKKCESQGPGV